MGCVDSEGVNSADDEGVPSCVDGASSSVMVGSTATSWYDALLII